MKAKNTTLLDKSLEEQSKWNSGSRHFKIGPMSILLISQAYASLISRNLSVVAQILGRENQESSDDDGLLSEALSSICQYVMFFRESNNYSQYVLSANLI